MKSFQLIILLSLLVFYKQTSAQVALEVKGQPFNDVSHTEVVGHPYLEDKWLIGTVVLDNNKIVSANLKFNVYLNQVLFQDRNGQGLELKNKFTGFTLNGVDSLVTNLNPAVFMNGYPSVADNNESTLYQLIADGKIKLLKYYKKAIKQDRQNNSSVVSNATSVLTSSYQSNQLYSVFANNRLKSLQLNKKSISKLFQDHAAEIDTYFNTNNVNFRSDSDLKKLFTWYNSLN